MGNTDDPLPALLDRVALGDRAAFELLYRLTSPRLFGVCLRVLGERTEAEEALQESYVRIWRRAATYTRTRAAAISWMAAIARNQSIDRLRTRKPRADTLDSLPALADDGPSPEAETIAADNRRRLQDCLARLQVRQAEAIRAAYFGGYTYEALARHMDVPLGTMKSWMRRSLLRLKVCLER